MKAETFAPNYLWNECKRETGESTLWHQVISNGIKGVLSVNRKKMYDDWNWMFGKQDYWNCFEHVCQITGNQPERIRKGIVKEFYRKYRHIAGPEYLPHREQIVLKYPEVFRKYLNAK